MGKDFTLHFSLDGEEKAVCNRLGSARRWAGLSQEDLADALGITRAQLANIETGRTELAFTLGWNACKRLDIRQLYLATGSQPVTPFFDAGPLEDLPSPNISFRRACVAGPISDLLNMVDCGSDMVGPGGSMEAYRRAASELFRTFLLRLPKDRYKDFLDTLYRAMMEFEAVSLKAVENISLTGIPPIRNTSDMVRDLKSLRARLRTATSDYGKKAELARHLETSLPRISEWLSDTEPGGETTLKLLNWVEQQEAKQKSPGSAETPPEPKAQVRKPSLNENQNSGRKKR